MTSHTLLSLDSSCSGLETTIHRGCPKQGYGGESCLLVEAWFWTHALGMYSVPTGMDAVIDGAGPMQRHRGRTQRPAVPLVQTISAAGTDFRHAARVSGVREADAVRADITRPSNIRARGAGGTVHVCVPSASMPLSLRMAAPAMQHCVEVTRRCSRLTKPSSAQSCRTDNPLPHPLPNRCIRCPDEALAEQRPAHRSVAPFPHATFIGHLPSERRIHCTRQRGTNGIAFGVRRAHPSTPQSVWMSRWDVPSALRSPWLPQMHPGSTGRRPRPAPRCRCAA